MPRVLERYTHAIAGRYNIAPGGEGVVTVNGGEMALRWGLLAPWRGHGGVRPPPIRTAQLDALVRTPVLARGQRCLVLADGWYTKEKQRAWWIHGSTAFAGVVATHKDDGIASFAIMMAGDLPAGAGEPWIERGEVSEVAWQRREISRYFEDVTHDDPRCIEPTGNPNQGELF